MLEEFVIVCPEIPWNTTPEKEDEADERHKGQTGGRWTVGAGTLDPWWMN